MSSRPDGRAGDQRWTLARAGVLVARRFHVRFGIARPDRILHRMGFMVQGSSRCRHCIPN
ncbi:winged helix-turn-helix domain-containing protein [Streptomyces sp. NPDC002466]|uniref:winged helix-turn-helix domain-containing protein n=1 Tax=Streptomyces sp. NPDC002466 TaxID=3364646 RepID=UPI0036912F49